MAARGDVDVLLVHDRVGEKKFLADGYGIDRRDVMHDDFVIVGPSSDPAGIRGLTDALTAFALIAAKGATFVSRGNSGGTYVMERRLWQSTGVDPAGAVWYRNLDEGLGATLNFAAAVNLYSSLLVNPAKWPDMKFKEAKRSHNWLTSRSGLDAITSYRIDGQQLFFPPLPHSRS
jgi:tungstate transport system substrate-binding protein